MTTAQRLQEVLGPEHFPPHLCDKYPHLAERVAVTWGSPALDIFLNELFFDRRGGRQGFEPEVMHELFIIQNLHQEKFQQDASDNPIWDEGTLDVQDLRADQKLYDTGTMMDAAKSDKLAIIHDGLANGFPINTNDANGLTMLWWATRYGHRELMLTLLKARARADVHDDFGCYPLHWLAAQDLVAAIELITQYGANLEVVDHEGATPLIYAAKRGSVAAAECLIKLGVDVNRADKHGMTALHHAADSAAGTMLELLREHDADPRLKDNHARTAADIALQKPDAQRLLLCLM